MPPPLPGIVDHIVQDHHIPVVLHVNAGARAARIVEVEAVLFSGPDVEDGIALDQCIRGNPPFGGTDDPGLAGLRNDIAADGQVAAAGADAARRSAADDVVGHDDAVVPRVPVPRLRPVVGDYADPVVAVAFDHIAVDQDLVRTARNMDAVRPLVVNEVVQNPDPRGVDRIDRRRG